MHIKNAFLRLASGSPEFWFELGLYIVAQHQFIEHLVNNSLWD